MIQYGVRLAAVLSFFALFACAPVISSEWRKEARKHLTFEQVLQNPSAYTGSVVIWGGIIIGVSNDQEGAEITVLETPLGSREKPEGSERTGGRFIAKTPQFLDPVVYASGRKVTIAGAITGAETKPIAKSKRSYTYPVVSIKQIHLWSIPEYSPPDYWWHGGPYGFRWDEGFGPGLGEEEEERGAVERGEGEQGEAEERGEGGRR